MPAKASPTDTRPRANVADRLAESSRLLSGRIALAAARPGKSGKPKAEAYETIRFAQLDERATTIARGLIEAGVQPGTRLALLVRPGIDFVALVFGLLRSGATMVLVDAGLGRKNIVRCLASTEPDGFVGIPAAHVLRCLFRRRFPLAKLNVTVGKKWFWGGNTLAQLEEIGCRSQAELPVTKADEKAAIVFTSGSTGPPKGVVYTQGTFVAQLAEIERIYDLKPGGVDLACFPLFGLFNVSLGITTVLPEMDFSRPASCDPSKLLQAANDWSVTQSFASPAVWGRVSRYAKKHGVVIPDLTRLFSCGAPVTQSIIERSLQVVAKSAEMHTPYGATEALPVCTIEAGELADTFAATAQGNGVCVGHKVDSIDWRIIPITDSPIGSIGEVDGVPRGEIGELVVRGPQVSQQYIAENAERANRLAKIADGDGVWHRMGDVGYFDDLGRFWYCGRKSQRVVLEELTLYTECVEGIANSHPSVNKSALVGVEHKGKTTALLVVEPMLGEWKANSDDELRRLLATHSLTDHVNQMLLRSKLPTDIRHNSKIRREQIAEWAARRVDL